MSLQSLLVFLLMVTGLFLIFNISPGHVTEIVVDWLDFSRDDIRSVIKQSKRNQVKRHNPFYKIKKTLLDARSVLLISGREALFSTLILVSVGLFVGGFLFGIVVNNFALSLTLSIGFGLVPFWYVKVTEINFLKELNDELESALSGISTAYKRTGNFKKAVEENLYHFNPPVSNIFEEFIFEITYVSPDMERAIEHMSEKLDNSIFKEWCTMVIACQDNPKLIPLLNDIVDKLADVKQTTSDLSINLTAPLRDNLLLALLCLSLYPLYFFIHIEWFNGLVNTDTGKVITAFVCASIFFVLSKSVDQTKPVEYEL